jgi:DNA (cytosine-5)-methyltransferase 1
VNVLDLFSGIGGFSLGLERAGMRTVAFCEIDPYCQRVLRKHWPDVPVFGDIRELTAASILANASWHVRAEQTASGTERQRIRTGGQSIDLICGGFPCQDISVAGKGAGIAGERSGLWKEYARIIGEVRPRYVIVENVGALLVRGLATVLGDLAALGYDAEWHCIPASAVGAPHRRDRLWIVAYPAGAGWRSERPAVTGETNGGWSFGKPSRTSDVADTEGGGPRCRWGGPAEKFIRLGTSAEWWLTEPDVGRVAHGISNRVHRLRALGNAVIPQIPELIGSAIMETENDRGRAIYHADPARTL